MDMQTPRLFFSVVLMAIMAPLNAFAVDIGGPTAEAWVTAGAAEGIGVTLVAIPANEASHAYSGSGVDAVFDAPDRDGLSRGTLGLGVDNTPIKNGDSGVSSKPSEIGYYQNSNICGDGKALGANCGDELRVGLDQGVYGGAVEVSLFYGSEESGETLAVQLYRDDVLVYDSVEGPANNGSFNSPALNPGKFTFELGDTCWDEIRFLGDERIVNDAADYLVEGISNLTVCEDPPEISFTQGFFGSSPQGEAMVAGLINDNNCADINTILASIGAIEETLDCLVPAEETESDLSHFLTGTVGAGKEKGGEIGFLPAGFAPNHNLAAQKITALLNMELEGGINAGNFLNIDLVDGLDPILTTGGQLGTCDDLLPLDPGPDGICDNFTIALNALGEVVALLDGEGTTVGDVLDVGDAYIQLEGENVDPTDTVFINGVVVTVEQLTKILGMINESYDAGTQTGFVTVSDVD